MTDAQKARLKELSAKSADQLSDAEKNEMSLLKTVEMQATQLAEKDTLIGKHATKLDDLTRQLASAKPEDKAALEAKIADQKDLIATLKDATEALRDANKATSDAATRISATKPGQGTFVDRKAIDALEDEVLGIEGGKERVEKAYSQLSDEDAEALETDLAFRNEFFSQALLAAKREKTTRSPWRTQPEDKGVPPQDVDATRIAKLFGNEQAIHRRLPPGSSGRAGAPGRVIDPGKPKPVEREVDTRTK